MTTAELKSRNLGKEIRFSASRAGGPGGQNVNKVNTRVELRLSIAYSVVLDENEKNIIMEKLAGRINREGELIIVSQRGRTQLANRMLAEEKLFKLIADALTPAEERKPTRPSRASVIERLQSKRIAGNRKRLRKAGTDELEE